jgi:hypothetical protein
MAKLNFDPEKVLAQIIEIERKFPVNDWKINGIHFWPYIRTSLAYIQRFDMDAAEETSNRRKSPVSEYSGILFSLPLHLLRLINNIKKANRLFVGAITHRSHINGKLRNRYFDVALTDFNEQNDHTIILDRGTSLDNHNFPNKENWFSLPSLYMLLEVKRRLRLAPKHTYSIELKDYDKFFEYIQTTLRNPAKIKSEFNERSLRKRMISLYDRKELWKSLLKKSNVRDVYVLCYYTSLFYPLLAACHELKINTTDIQHGGIGKGHWSYDEWSQVPSGGYALLPHFFWSWDHNTAKLINQWASRSDFHQAINFGTPWINDYRDTSDYKPAHKNYVLYNMVDAVIDDYIAEAMRHFGAEVRWVLRMHPRFLSLRPELEQQISLHNVGEFVTIEDSTKVLLADSIRHCSALVSVSSGSVIEAVQAGIKPILLPSAGFNYYEEYVKSGLVVPVYEKNGSTLITALEHVSATSTTGTHAVAYNNAFRDFEKLTASQIPTRQ